MAEYGEELSERELDVLRCVARGASNKEAAAELFISENTVKVHLRRVFTKLGVSSRTEATRVAIQQGLVSVPGVEVEASQDDDLLAEMEEEELEEESALEPELAATTAVTPTTHNELEPDTTLPADPPRQFTLWRTVSLVLTVLLVVAITAFVSLRLQANNSVPEPEPFVEEPLGQDWVLTNRPLPVGLVDVAAVPLGLNIYVIGGETADTVVSTNYSFDALTHLWQERTPKPTAVASASATELFGEIYVVGGRLADGQPTAAVEVYSPTQNAWRPVTALPQPISGGVALSDGSFLYLVGGWNGSDYLNTTYIYDPGEDSWRPLDPMSQPRAFATGQFMTGELYVVGGFDGQQELDTCEYFDPTLLQWFDCPPLLLPRGGSASAAVLNRLYVIGGGLQDGQEIRYSEQYDPVTQTWQVVNTPLLNEAPSWTGLGVANVENRIFVLGGRRTGDTISDTYIFSPFVYRTFLPSIPVRGDE